MRIPLSWLKSLVDIPEDLEALSQTMTQLGMEVESIEKVGADFSGVLVGQVVEIESHPDADKLSVCKTDVGQDEPLQIICGAKNFKVGDKVPTAVVGSVLPGDFKIDSRKMRGVKSFGMMCAPGELGLEGDDAGLLILPENATVGMELSEYLGISDHVIEIEVTPNRGDWAGMIGIARELAARYETQLKLPELSISSADGGDPKTTITIDAPDLCPRYSGRVITGVKIGPSPDWMQQHLIAAGQRPINNIVDITNYVLMETAHPLHAFDFDKLNEGRIVVRRAADGEKIKTIDQEDRTLDSDMLVIADASVPVAVAGVMGGFDSEVGEGTTTILLESASFNPKSIRATSKKLNLRSEASQRFQRGSDIEMVEWAANRATQLICEIAGGEVSGALVDTYPSKIESATAPLRYARAGEFLGEDIDADKQDGYLARLGFAKAGQSNGSANFTIPTWRPDVSGEHDLIEEIARLHGYDNFPSTLPKISYAGAEDADHQRAIDNLRRQLASMGFTEFIGFAFTSEEAMASCRMESMKEASVPLSNPISENLAIMRPTLLPGMIERVATNLKKGAKGVRAFEVAPVYTKSEESDTGAIETLYLTIALAGQPSDRDWSRTQPGYDVYDIIGVCETLFTIYDVNKIRKSELEEGPYQSGQAIALAQRKTPIGTCGKVDPEVADQFNANADIFVAHLNLEVLLQPAKTAEINNDIPQYPASERDIAVIVAEDAPAGDIVTAAEKAGGSMLTKAELIDIYRGEQIPEGKKSLAINLVYQAPDRTLTDDDTEKSVKKILKTLAHQYSAELRG